MKSTLLKVLWFGTAAALIAWITHSGLTTPSVTVSHSKWLELDYLSDEHAGEDELIAGSCVKVEPAKAGSCIDIPKKHYLVWSK